VVITAKPKPMAIAGIAITAELKKKSPEMKEEE
jgi:hypothetical protein